MGRKTQRNAGVAIALFGCFALSSCTHKVQIEPSDKPFIVNLNVKVDHEIKYKIEKENEDLLNLESTATKGKNGGKKK